MLRRRHVVSDYLWFYQQMVETNKKLSDSQRIVVTLKTQNYMNQLKKNAATNETNIANIREQRLVFFRFDL